MTNSNSPKNLETPNTHKSTAIIPTASQFNTVNRLQPARAT